jgi:MscS family membrane protein
MHVHRKDAWFARAVLMFLFGLILLILPDRYGIAGPKPRPNDAGKITSNNATLTQPEKTPPVQAILGPVDDYDRGVPRTSVMGFLEAARKGNYERAAQYLDLRGLPPSVKNIPGPELAKQLKIILDRTLWIDLDLLSSDPNGYSDDGLPSNQDLLGQIEIKTKKYALLLQHVPRADGVLIWKVSKKTVGEIPAMYEKVGYGRIGEYLSSRLPDIEILGTRLWQLVGFIMLIAVSTLAAFLPTWLAAVLLLRRGTEKSILVAQFLGGPLRLLIGVLMVRYFTDVLNPTVAMQQIAQAGTLLIAAVTWVTIRLADVFLDYQRDRITRGERAGVPALFKPLKIIARLLIMIIAVAVWLDNMGVSVTAIITGLGVGGIAVALAAQRTFEDIIGTIILFISQPVKIGDFGKFGNTLGTIEEIGLRATRVRTLENTLITISNSEFSRMPLESFTARERIWYHPRLDLPYETDSKTIRTIIDRVGSLLRSDPRVFADSARIRFVEMGSYALHLDVFAYVKEQDYARYLAVAEELNFAIMEIVENAGARLALPSQELYLDHGGNQSTSATETGGSTVDDRG